MKCYEAGRVYDNFFPAMTQSATSKMIVMLPLKLPEMEPVVEYLSIYQWQTNCLILLIYYAATDKFKEV
jgi:hypothetical protein